MNALELAAILAARPEIASVIQRLAEPAPTAIRQPSDAVAAFVSLLGARETEALAVVALDRKNRIIDSAILTTGSDAATVVDVRQILRWTLTRSRPAAAFMIAHNHPSGDPEPSTEDYTATRAVRKAADAVGLSFLDHLVVTDGGGYTSLAARGAV